MFRYLNSPRERQVRQDYFLTKSYRLGRMKTPDSELESTFRLRPLSELWALVKDKAKPLRWEDRWIVGGGIQAAVMFIDLCDFTRMGWEHRDRPQAAAILGHEGLRRIEEWCGQMPSLRYAYVDKVLGDAALLVIPGPRDRAMEDVLWISHGAFFGPEFPCKIGAHWGRVFLGDIGLKDRGKLDSRIPALTVMGPVVNLASRLCGAAKTRRELVLLSQRLTSSPRPLQGIRLHIDGTLSHFKTRGYERGLLKGCGDNALRIVRLLGGGMDITIDESAKLDPRDPRATERATFEEAIKATEGELALAVCRNPKIPDLD